MNKHTEALKLALEDVYETIIQWDEGGGKRSRRELARRIVALYTSPPASKPLTQDMVESCPYDEETLRGAFFDGWLKAEDAHGIKGGA